MSKTLTYDKAYKELHDILQSLQRDEVSIDQLSTQLQRATELSEYCKTMLRSIEKEIEKIKPIASFDE